VSAFLSTRFFYADVAARLGFDQNITSIRQIMAAYGRKNAIFKTRRAILVQHPGLGRRPILAPHIFFIIILGAFGLVATSADALRKPQASPQQ
jgi:hypothetical protein